MISPFSEEEPGRDDFLTIPQLLYEGYVFQIKISLIPKPKLVELRPWWLMRDGASARSPWPRFLLKPAGASQGHGSG